MYCTVCMKIDNISPSVELQDTPQARKQETAALPLSSRFLTTVCAYDSVIHYLISVSAVVDQEEVGEAIVVQSTASHETPGTS